MEKFFLLIIFSFFINGIAEAQTKKTLNDVEQVAQDFKESKFLQTDSIELPAELRKIEDEIKQNAVDVIIHSRTHTPIFSQKREDGYNENYKKFYGLKITIFPILDETDFYSLNLFYYNWTSNKFDKTLKRRISKYNVLNEIRFALYELLLGKIFVKEHKDEIEKQNFDRIQAVREAVNKQKKNEKKERLQNKIKEEEEKEKAEERKKKNKLMREEKEKEKARALVPSNSEIQNSMSQNDESESENAQDESGNDQNIEKNLAKINKQNKKGKLKNEATIDKVGEVIPNDPQVVDAKVEQLGPSSSSTPTKSSFYLFTSYFSESSESVGLIQTTTNLKYVGFGAKYIMEEISENPRGLRFTLRTGIPILKQDYQFPVYRAVETEIYWANSAKYFQLFSGLDYSPNNFVNLPGFGETLQVFENDFLWLKIGLGYRRELGGHEMVMRASYLKSLMMSSNQKKKFTANRYNISTDYQMTRKHGIELGFQKTALSGEITDESKRWLVSYLYKFEN